MNRKIVSKFGYCKKECSVILLMIEINSKIFFWKTVLPFSLSFSLGIKRYSWSSLNTEAINRVCSKPRSAKWSIIRNNCWKYSMQSNKFLYDYFSNLFYCYVWAKRYLVTFLRVGPNQKRFSCKDLYIKLFFIYQ